MVYMDQKISSKPDKEGCTRLLGMVDSCTKKCWLKPLPDGTSASVQKAVSDWLVNDLHNRPVKHLRMDNDPAFVSEEFTDFLVKEKIPVTNSSAYHQHQNAPIEAQWASLKA